MDIVIASRPMGESSEQRKNSPASGGDEEGLPSLLGILLLPLMLAAVAVVVGVKKMVRWVVGK